jgi:serine/threonine-protein kinase
LLGPQESEPAEHLETQWPDIETIRKAGQPSTRPKPTNESLPPDFGHFRIEKRLGRGCSSVFEATDTMLNRTVALKVPQLDGDLNEAARSRFQREARAAAAAYHPLLCPVLEIGQINGMDYFAMPYVEGEPLSQVLHQRSVWPTRLAVIFISKLAMAVAAAHRQNLIHRDLRPANILITASETPVIVGFGSMVANIVPSAPEDASYLAPEHAQGEEQMGPQADVYSLGVLLFQLLTGDTPPEGLPDSAFPADLPPELKDFCRRTLAVNPDDRPSSLDEFVQSLNGFLGKLRPSDFDLPGAALSGSAQGRRLAGSAMGLPPPAQPTAAGPIASAAMSQMQELRQLSNWKSTPPSQRPVPKRHFPWPWYVSSGLIGAAITLIALAVFHRDAGVDGNEPSTNPPGQGAQGPSLKELLQDLQRSPTPEKRDQELAKIRARNNPADAKELDRLITENEWADVKSDSDADKENAFLALQAIDSAQLTKSLRSAIDSKNARIRAWACDKIAISNDAALLPELHAALNDRHGLVRKAAADALRTMSPKDRETVEALERRIADDDWISKAFSSTKEGPVDDPDNGGKKAALDALKVIDMKRVPEALKKARESKNSTVRKWAEQELARLK